MSVLLCRKSEGGCEEGGYVCVLCVCVWWLVVMDGGLDNEDTQ